MKEKEEKIVSEDASKKCSTEVQVFLDTVVSYINEAVAKAVSAAVQPEPHVQPEPDTNVQTHELNPDVPAQGAAELYDKYPYLRKGRGFCKTFLAPAPGHALPMMALVDLLRTWLKSNITEPQVRHLLHYSLPGCRFCHTKRGTWRRFDMLDGYTLQNVDVLTGDFDFLYKGCVLPGAANK